MGLLDVEAVGAAARPHSETILAALHERGVEASPFAQEIAALFIASHYLEPSRTVEEIGYSVYAGRFDEGVNPALFEAVTQMVDAYQINERQHATNLVTAVDVFHWISDYGSTIQRILAWSVLPGRDKE